MMSSFVESITKSVIQLIQSPASYSEIPNSDKCLDEDRSNDDRFEDDQSKDDQSKDDQSEDDQSKDDQSEDDQSNDDRLEDDRLEDDISENHQSEDDQLGEIQTGDSSDDLIVQNPQKLQINEYIKSILFTPNDTNHTDESMQTEPSRDSKFRANDFDKLLAEKRKERNKQDIVITATYKNDEERLRIYNDIVQESLSIKGNRYIDSMMVQIHPGDITKQGIFIPCPNDINKGSFFFAEDKFTILYGAETDKKIRNGCNEELFQCINNTEVTIGMMKSAEGLKWQNGLIAYNKNVIILRDPDNEYGQPGFMQGCYFYNRLGVEVMNRYIVPRLIHEINNNVINTTNGYQIANQLVIETYNNIYAKKLVILNDPERYHIEDSILFEDAPSREKLLSSDQLKTTSIKQLIDANFEKDKKIDALEKKLESTNAKLNNVLIKIVELEEMYLDLSIKTNTKNITPDLL
jgi:hypothetical protein